MERSYKYIAKWWKELIFLNHISEMVSHLNLDYYLFPLHFQMRKSGCLKDSIGFWGRVGLSLTCSTKLAESISRKIYYLE
jgi:hypothetical protein